jgi:opacity protein-like surface antigen
MRTHKRPSTLAIVTGLLALPALLLSTAATGHAQSVGISLSPAVQRIDWSDDLAFSNDWLYGGRLSLLFGKYVELQPFYFTQDGYDLDSSRVESVFGPAARGRSLDMRHYGTSVQLNLGSGAIVPFIRTSAGVLRLKPDSAERQDRITVSAGGGLRFGVAGLNAELFAEQMGFRMNPRGLFGPDTTGASTLTLRNLVYGAAVTIPLSTAREADMQDEGLRGSTAPIEPFVGVLRYDGAHGMADLELAGVRAGIDFSPVFGVRGFYWRGLNDDRDGTVPVTGYGGEAQFNLNTGPGLSPYLIVGAGQIDYSDEFRDSMGQPRSDQTAFILGGGASFRLTDRLRLNGAIRDYIMTTEESLDNVSSTLDITHNTMLTAGLTISLGGHTNTPDRARPSQGESARA